MAGELPFPLPSPLVNIWESLMMRGYGTDFLPEQRAHWSRRISYFDSPGFQWVTKLTSYSHTLATKARGKGP